MSATNTSEKLILGMAIRYALEKSTRQLGSVATHLDEELVGTLSSIEGSIAVLSFPGGRLARHPLAEVFDPNLALSYVRNPVWW